MKYSLLNQTSELQLLLYYFLYSFFWINMPTILRNPIDASPVFSCFFAKFGGADIEPGIELTFSLIFEENRLNHLDNIGWTFTNTWETCDWLILDC